VKKFVGLRIKAYLWSERRTIDKEKRKDSISQKEKVLISGQNEQPEVEEEPGEGRNREARA